MRSGPKQLWSRPRQRGLPPVFRERQSLHALQPDGCVCAARPSPGRYRTALAMLILTLFRSEARLTTSSIYQPALRAPIGSPSFACSEKIFYFAPSPRLSAGCNRSRLPSRLPTHLSPAPPCYLLNRAIGFYAGNRRTNYGEPATLGLFFRMTKSPPREPQLHVRYCEDIDRCQLLRRAPRNPANFGRR